MYDDEFPRFGSCIKGIRLTQEQYDSLVTEVKDFNGWGYDISQ